MPAARSYRKPLLQMCLRWPGTEKLAVLPGSSCQPRVVTQRLLACLPGAQLRQAFSQPALNGRLPPRGQQRHAMRPDGP